MGHLCEYCKRKLNKGERFILYGDYPGTWDRAAARIWYTFADDFAEYGAVYHEECFFTILKNNRPDRYKKKGG
jgi:hypothetical protein